jgi:hypothetical protein
MQPELPHSHSHLFTIRLWEENLGAGEKEWRGRIQSIATGETAHFRDWPGLVSVLSRLVENCVALPPADDSQPASPAGPSSC